MVFEKLKRSDVKRGINAIVFITLHWFGENNCFYAFVKEQFIQTIDK